MEELFATFEGFHLNDEGEDMDHVLADYTDEDGTNSPDKWAGEKGQRDLLHNSPWITLIGKLKTHLTTQPKMLFPGVPFKLILTKNKDNFILRSNEDDATKVPKIQWGKIVLRVKKVKLYEDLQKHMVQTLMKLPQVNYPIVRDAQQHHVIPPNTQNITIPRFTTGDLPRRMIVGLVRNGAVSGDFRYSPYAFKHWNVQEMWVSFQDKDYPTLHYKCNFAEPYTCLKA